MKPKLFVGSSVEGLSVAYAVQQNLQFQAEVTVWDQGVFNLSKTAVDSLMQVLNRTDFGVFIFTPDDIVNIRGEENRTVRDNVLFELGLFVGGLGKDRSFILVPQGQTDLHLPTDLVGMTPGTYETDRTDESYQAATGPACHEIRQAIALLGALSKGSDLPQKPQSRERNMEAKAAGEEQTKIESAQGADEFDEPDWIEVFTSKKYDEAISIFEKKIESTEREEEKIRFSAWIGRAKARQDLQAGLEYLSNMKAKYPESEEVYSAIAFAYASYELFDEALAALDQGLLASTTDKEWLLVSKADNLNEAGRIDEALNVLAELIKEMPKFELAYARLAQILAEQGKKDEAILTLEAGLKELPVSETLLFQYASLLLDMDHNEAAIANFRKLVGIAPKNATYQATLGNVYLNLELNGLALRAYQRANELAQEQEAWIIGNIGNLFINQGFYFDAIGYLKKAIGLDASSAYAHDRLSNAIKQHEEEEKKVVEIIRKYKSSERHEPAGTVGEGTT